MSYPLDSDAQSAWLDGVLGDNAASTMPTQFEFALFAGDPDNGGVEMDSVGGYARVVIDNDSTQWPDAVAGVKTGLAVAFADPSDAWTAGSAAVPATHWLLIDHADSTTRHISRALSPSLLVLGTEVDITVTPIVTWNTES